MGFSTPAWISQLPPAPTESALEAGNKGALAGYQLGQMKATRSALQNTDVNNPDSVNTAIGALVRAGASDQATSLMNLNFIRDLRSRVPALFDEISGKTAQPAPTPVSQASQTSDGEMTSDQHQHVADTMSQGVDALKAIRALPPEQRAAAFAQAKDAFVQRGIPPEAVDAVGHDLSDAGLDQQIAYLGAHGDHFGARATGAESTAPTMAHPGQYGWASRVMDSPQIQLGIALAKSAGLDLSGLTSTAQALVMPQINEQAKADYAQQVAQGQTAGTNLANTNPLTAPPAFKGAVSDPMHPGGQTMLHGAAQGQTAEAAAGALGTEAGSHGGEVLYRADGTPVVQPVAGAAPTAAGYGGAVSGAQAGATAAATAPYELVPGITDPATGAPLYRTKADVAARNVPNAGVSPGQGNVNIASANQLATDRQASGALQQQLIPLRTAYDLVHSGQVRLGPGTETFNRVQSFITNTLHLDQSAVANYDQVHKYLVQIANQRATQFGAGTNEKLAVAASGSPNVDMSSLGAAEVLRVNIALARADAAKAAAYGNQAPEGYATFASQYGRTTDPRAFMLDMLTPTERSRVYDQISKGTPSEKAAFANGVIAAEAAGYFHRSDVARRH